MNKYYVITKDGKKGPFPADRIAAAVQSGQMPLEAKLEEAETGKLLSAQQAANSYVAASPSNVVDSTPMPTAPQPAPRQPNYPPSPTAQPQYPAAQQYPQNPQTQQSGPYPPQPQYSQQYPQQGAASSGYQQAYPAQQPYPQQAQNPYGHIPQQQYYAAAPGTSGLSIAALVLSLTSLVMCPIPLWIGGIICGVMALKETAPNGPKGGRGMALTGIWAGAAIGVLTLIGVAFFIALEA
ncbi:DUF4190 domain-containing protein [Planctomycetota bacterium]|nr:DUF4190 domain-containing protein [Planctomycetota bacterium]